MSSSTSQHLTVAANPGYVRSAARRPALQRIVVHLVLGIATAVAGTLLGLALTAAALRHGGEIGTTTAGPWRLSLGEGTPAINPYQRAIFARNGTIPMSAGQAVTLTATRDDAGRKLNQRCSYSVGGAIPRARFWTLGALDAQGFPIGNEAERHAFTSADVLRDSTGAFSVTLSPEAQPGNWLPLGDEGLFILILRLYSSGLGGPGPQRLQAASVPSITPVRCG